MSRPASRHLAFESVVDDDATIARLLEDLSVPVLMAAVVQITGDPSYVRGPIRPRELIYNELQGKLTADEKAELRGQALAAIGAWRDAGCPAPSVPDAELMHEIMSWIGCESIPADYADLYREELDLAGDNPRAIPASTTANPRQISVIVIGCGESGLLAALRLREAGIPFTIIEKNDDVGGTWLENVYPGCRVDVASHYYSYSFGPPDEFSEYYAQQPELYRYFRRLLDEEDIGGAVRWRTRVTAAAWDESTAQWNVTVSGPDGSTEVLSADAVISGVGILNRPFIPDIPGLAEFPGPVFHSATYDKNVDVRGKRLALIGAGASGFQLGPAVVDEVAQLTVFQRSPQWMSPNPRYHDAVKPGERWAMRHLPSYGRWYRFLLMWQSSDKLLEMVRVDPDWPDFPSTANAFSAQRREVLAAWIETNVGDDPELLAKVMPTYPPMAKRMLQDNGSWLRCLRREHVELITDPILEIDRSTIVTATGRHEVDIIVLATGFRATEVLSPIDFIGRNGRSIADVWDGRPSAYRGITVPDFPNLFILGGPGSGLAHAGSVIFMNEAQMRYVGDALRLLQDGHRTVEPTQAAHDRYAGELQAEVASLMWGHPSIKHSWYKSPDGNVYVLAPWRLVDYWKMTARVDEDDHVLG